MSANINAAAINFLFNFNRLAARYDSVLETLEDPQVAVFVPQIVDFSKPDSASAVAKLHKSLYPKWLNARYPVGGDDELGLVKMLKLGKEILQFPHDDPADFVVKCLAAGEREQRWSCEAIEAFNKVFWTDVVAQTNFDPFAWENLIDRASHRDALGSSMQSEP